MGTDNIKDCIECINGQGGVCRPYKVGLCKDKSRFISIHIKDKEMPSNEHWDMVEVEDIQKPLPNQSIKADKGKPRISLVPPAIIEAIAEVREYGTKKYGATEAWREVEQQRYIDALLRHTVEYMRNQEGRDSESGILHIKHMACNIAFLLELDKEPKEHPYSRRSFTYEQIENTE